jgi:hypothetical protein
VLTLLCTLNDTTFVPACTKSVSTLSGDGLIPGLVLEDGSISFDGRVWTRRTPKRCAFSGVDGDDDCMVPILFIRRAAFFVNGSVTRSRWYGDWSGVLGDMRGVCLFAGGR